MPVEDGPVATVIICTRNRASSLVRTLASLVDAAAKVSQPWELLVVDNGSSDNTPEVIAGFADRLPIRRVFQPVAGLSNARNAGIAEARGALIVWTDDDVLVDPDWLAAYIRAFEQSPDIGIFGGRIIPTLEEPITPWFSQGMEHLGFLLAHRDSPDWVEINADRMPYGASFAVRAQVQRRFGFDPELGVAPGRRLGGEETSMITTALASGVEGRWVWDARARHLIQPERQNLPYVFQYYRSLGYGHPKVKLGDAPASRILAFGVVCTRLVRKAAMARLRRAMGNPLWLASYTEYARSVGALDRLLGRTPA